MKPYVPRTPADWRLLGRLVRSGHSNETILNLYEKQNWRSEVYFFAGTTYCACCNQPITLEECSGCGQTIHERNDSL